MRPFFFKFGILLLLLLLKVGKSNKGGNGAQIQLLPSMLYEVLQLDNARELHPGESRVASQKNMMLPNVGLATKWGELRNMIERI